jgi:hypothetical protein
VWDKRNVYSIFVRRHERNKQLGRCQCRWSDGAIVDIKEILFEYGFICVVQCGAYWWNGGHDSKAPCFVNDESVVAC